MEYPKTPDLTIMVGDYVRSFDFPGDTRCFYEGTVEAIEDSRYRVAVARRVFDGVEVSYSSVSHIWCPINGQIGIFGLTRGVVRAEICD